MGGNEIRAAGWDDVSEQDDEEDLFRREMSDVRRLGNVPDTAEVTQRRPPPLPLQRIADDRAVMRELLSGSDEDELGAERGESLSYLREGYQRRVLRRLKRGQFSIHGELDLHGMTAVEARGALADFLLECRRRDCRCVRIIHGKGRRSTNHGPVLKGKVDRWLRQRDEVIAFCSARPVDGGTGAVYVLMRP